MLIGKYKWKRIKENRYKRKLLGLLGRGKQIGYLKKRLLSQLNNTRKDCAKRTKRRDMVYVVDAEEF